MIGKMLYGHMDRIDFVFNHPYHHTCHRFSQVFFIHPTFRRVWMFNPLHLEAQKQLTAETTERQIDEARLQYVPVACCWSRFMLLSHCVDGKVR